MTNTKQIAALRFLFQRRLNVFDYLNVLWVFGLVDVVPAFPWFIMFMCGVVISTRMERIMGLEND